MCEEKIDNEEKSQGQMKAFSVSVLTKNADSEPGHEPTISAEVTQ